MLSDYMIFKEIRLQYRTKGSIVRKLNSRVLSSDELELTALFITNKQSFIQVCNSKDYFISFSLSNGFLTNFIILVLDLKMS